MFSHDKDPATVVCQADHGRIKRGAIVPKSNELYADVEGWLSEGNQMLPFDGYPDTRTQAERLVDTKRGLTQAVQSHMDTIAGERNYDNIMSLCTYATSTNAKFAAEGQAGVEWRDAVWSACYQMLAEVESGTRTVPTETELRAELPAMQWPA